MYFFEGWSRVFKRRWHRCAKCSDNTFQIVMEDSPNLCVSCSMETSIYIPTRVFVLESSVQVQVKEEMFFGRGALLEHMSCL